MATNPDAKYQVSEYLEHFSPVLSQDIQDYAINEALSYSRYLFVKTIKGVQYGYCTHCKNEVSLLNAVRITSGDLTSHLKLKHNAECYCSSCGSWCVVKHAGRGRNDLWDGHFFVHYEKSIKDPDTVLARGIKVTRDYSGDYKDVKTSYMEYCLYIFKVGVPPVMLIMDYLMGWRKTSKVYPYSNKYINTGWMSTRVGVSVNMNSIIKAISGTPFGYFDIKKYKNELKGSDYTSFFATYSRYPAIESIDKLGFKQLVTQKIKGWAIKQINWKGKTIPKIFKMPKQNFNDIRQISGSIDTDFLKLYHISLKDGSKLDAYSIRDIHISSLREDVLEEVLKCCSLKKMWSYIQKQCLKAPKHFRSRSDTLTQWRDYLRDCKTLDYDMKDESILYPSNLKKAHEFTIKMVQDTKNERLDLKIKNRLKVLKKYCFKHSGFFIRPAENAQELIDEGKALSHCVGRYAEDYADGKTNIFFVRKVEEPDKPFVTVEIGSYYSSVHKTNTFTIRQSRGLKNCNPPEEVNKFIELFKSEVLNKKSKVKLKEVV